MGQEYGRELELYIHIPFCVKKCDYCDFLSTTASEEIHLAYTGQLLKEITACAGAYQGDTVTTLFIGGGTPSILAPYSIQELMDRLRCCFSVAADAEVTIEANPGTLNEEKLHAYQKAGVNRLSIGLQSADERELQLLGRIHTFGQFLENYHLARTIGFKNINVDIISAIPGQKLDTYKNTLMQVLELRPEHISAYSLMIEEGTPFFARYREAERLREKGKPQNLLPSEEAERQMYECTKQLLADRGYERYEISNYALPGYACRHNTGYWTRKNYLGLGLGAASMVGQVRFSNTANLQTYLACDFAKIPVMERYRERRELSVQEQMEEFMFLGLRLMRGVSAAEFFQQFSIEMEDVYGEILSRQAKQYLIEKTAEGYRLTDYGIDVSNYVMAQYLLDV